MFCQRISSCMVLWHPYATRRFLCYFWLSLVVFHCTQVAITSRILFSFFIFLDQRGEFPSSCPSLPASRFGDTSSMCIRPCIFALFWMLKVFFVGFCEISGEKMPKYQPDQFHLLSSTASCCDLKFQSINSLTYWWSNIERFLPWPFPKGKPRSSSYPGHSFIHWFIHL